jgi:CBS domain containing-hemolysin-like protein
MDTILWVKLGVIMLLVMGNAYFVGSEVALTAARRSRIKQLADTGNKSANYVQILHNEPERFYSVIQIGITIVSMGLGAIGIVTIEHLVDPWFEAASH